MRPDSQTPSNVLLVLLRLDLKAPQQLLRGGPQGEPVQFLVEGKQYHLLAGVLDPTNRSSGAPVTLIELTGGKLKIYNDVLRGFQEISQKFYGKSGFIAQPESYTSDRQEEVYNKISEVGRLISELFQDDDPSKKERRPIRDWLDKLLHSDPAYKDQKTQSVTIVTNDLNVPWFWLKRQKYGPFLCEVCPLGLLQLSAGSGELDTPQVIRRDKTYGALVIDGTTNLPFAEEELGAISGFLGDATRWSKVRTFKPHRANGFDEIRKIRLEYGRDRFLSDFRIIHFSGYYDQETLLLKDEKVGWEDLRNVLPGSLLVLDGASCADDFGAWTDVLGLTSSLINEGQALGCLVNVLPVKDDPISSRVLWEAFYWELRRGTNTIAHALFKARQKLRDHFEDTGSKNPAWVFYQFMGSAAVQLCDDEDERDA
jgi:hypothetical protein